MPFPILDAAVAAVALLLALAIDRWWGEPPAALHPVVWMGRALGACGARVAPAQATGRDLWSFWLAALVWCALTAIVLVVSGALQWAALAYLPAWGAALALGLLLKPLLAWRMLRREVLAVEAALGESLEAGRARLAWLVSRDVRQLDAAAVRESAIESLAENLSDSVVAPLFWFVLLGLPGAALYRFANTADAMWGYPGMRGGRYWQWAGKWAARADDALSWLPARLTALLLWLAARGMRWSALRALARATPSPNGGWPMGAMALALGVRLSKPGVYVLNAAGRTARAEDTRRAVELASRSIAALIPLLLAALLLIAIVRRHV
ncbi:cobalamin biosynthesis protein CobD [Alicycliphilus denitrificans]|uniref:adenosylcobinamide-phosphate synthase CbiB n=1 Tax=Alicycliphilus denitrificans TaxID=179636 RepID=UPI000959558B|nr:adenosylcobinamide-phosphate synthase CbiB [Alicycliphilus denitrificans]MBN9574667.1 cobalamin biosynthesis protein CobD [Alicycliphilus denitrificans]OJW85861.1 MAG: cobalamin biosynthesis protein CobD [Alicycliphilus sp. 69-12]BCN40188.1 cobalamin biosynthesis protein CobD [Alicycliphilus denitrificans]